MAHTDATVKTHIAAILGQAESDLSASYTTLITVALTRANNLVESILIGERGYTKAQLATWDSLDDYILDLATYYVFRDLTDQRGIDWERIQSWNREKDLRKIAILTTAEVPIETAEEVDGGALDDGEVIPISLTDDSYPEELEVL